jgi:hypothetical protein
MRSGWLSRRSTAIEAIHRNSPAADLLRPGPAGSAWCRYEQRYADAASSSGESDRVAIRSRQAFSFS